MINGLLPTVTIGPIASPLTHPHAHQKARVLCLGLVLLALALVVQDD